MYVVLDFDLQTYRNKTVYVVFDEESDVLDPRALNMESQKMLRKNVPYINDV